MKLPTATYRLQFRNGMDFARAATLVPYWRDLGISHLYASPVFTAATGSTHGYDVTDPNEVEPLLGGRAGLEGLASALQAQGIGLILDIVPNHLAFSPETPWLDDVLRQGEDSAYARYFDIDWSAGRLRLPWLPAPFEEMVEQGKISIAGDRIQASDLTLPLRPGSATGDPRTTHDAQAWRVTHWRTEAAAITHRRFFTVTGLIGMRVEDEQVFEDMHRLTFDLIDAGVAQGLRVDHVDGLADPGTYLNRLRARLPDTPIWIEKILTGDEPLPDWPVQGTTGYEAAVAITRVLTDGTGVERIKAATQLDADFRAELAAAKDQIVTTELMAELDALTDLAMAADATTEWGRGHWRDAIVAFIGAFPRYRSYAAEAVPEADDALIRDTAARAAKGLRHPGALPDLARLLTDPDRPALRVRMQQVTGAAIAKAQEDTAFYRFVPLLSANEVGSEPDEPSMDVRAFHAAMQDRARTQPAGLTLLSSHDTKRSADARARLIALSHDPGALPGILDAVPALPDPWSWYLAQSTWAGAPDGDLHDRLPAHLEKAMREAKRDTTWTDPDPAFEQPILDAAAHVMPPDLSDLARRAEGIALAQAALQLTVPGIPDIYQGTEIGSYRLTDPDNRAEVDFDRLADGAVTGFDRVKLSLTRALLRLRRDDRDAFATPYRPVDAGPGQLSFDRGPIRVTVSTDGTPLSEAPAIWPPADLEPQSVRIERVETSRG
ncbi:malto-oligosyltrehalose synthase [Jannaschia rubra]|uniref:malto-oligosyltrehalose synthase n=1 Tax=Jannaschia rubra TaxID=282197 RepID=UPI00249316FF|nr:malto-oligosyltrehalose synthase [Jannaschia rubra]